jgi:hypothetical protein
MATRGFPRVHAWPPIWMPGGRGSEGEFGAEGVLVSVKRRDLPTRGRRPRVVVENHVVLPPGRASCAHAPYRLTRCPSGPGFWNTASP